MNMIDIITDVMNIMIIVNTVNTVNIVDNINYQQHRSILISIVHYLPITGLWGVCRPIHPPGP